MAELDAKPGKIILQPIFFRSQAHVQDFPHPPPPYCLLKITATSSYATLCSPMQLCQRSALCLPQEFAYLFPWPKISLSWVHLDLCQLYKARINVLVMCYLFYSEAHCVCSVRVQEDCNSSLLPDTSRNGTLMVQLLSIPLPSLP